MKGSRLETWIIRIATGDGWRWIEPAAAVIAIAKRPHQKGLGVTLDYPSRRVGVYAHLASRNRGPLKNGNVMREERGSPLRLTSCQVRQS